MKIHQLQRDGLNETGETRDEDRDGLNEHWKHRKFWRTRKSRDEHHDGPMIIGTVGQAVKNVVNANVKGLFWAYAQ